MPATAEESRHDLGPAAKIRQPAQNAIRGEDDVELAGQLGHELVDIGFYQGGGDAHALGQRPRVLDGLGRKVDPGHLRRLLPDAERVHPKVTLEMEDRLSCQLAETGPHDFI